MVLKNEQHLNIDYNFDHQMSLSKSKCWYSNNCLQFLKHAVPSLQMLKKKLLTILDWPKNLPGASTRA
jgi:hypothetical protein